jgi:pyridoxal phosphate enzyme (YggS family)
MLITPQNQGPNTATPPSNPVKGAVLGLAHTRARLAAAARAAGRPPQEIHLLAVSKQQSVEAIRTLAEAGQRHFGESYSQEALPKIAALREPAQTAAAPPDRRPFSEAAQEAAQEAADQGGDSDSPPHDLVWHFIGQVQTNKTRVVAEHFQWVHTLDRVKIAQRLNDQRPEHLGPLNVCIQVKLAEESGKGGIDPQEIVTLAAAISPLPRLKLRGLMCLPPPQPTFETQKPYFDSLAEQLRALQRAGFEVDTLSMGMSDDVEAAVAAGATWVRIGTAIFGARPR